ncbi:dihydropteroate synthase [bacterium]|nr:dihydropteroate synthase [bacterium]
MILNIRGNRYNTKDFPLILGILNLTPDSFSDGGKYNTEYKALKKVENFLKEDVDIIDIGAESSRPNSKRISLSEERRRLFPIISKIKKKFNVILSLDTMKSEIANEGFDKGIEIINDVSGFMYDDNMPNIIGKNNGAVILNHSSALPETMQKNTKYKNIFNDIRAFFTNRIKKCIKNNISYKSIILDPGIGFGKDTQQNINLIKNVKKFKKFDLPLMYGVSNKKFLGDILGINNPEKRVNASVITGLILLINGVNLLRVHNVKETKEMLKLWRALK